MNNSLPPVTPLSFKDCHVVITGAGRDFGRTQALMFAQAGAHVYLSARSLEAAQKVQQEAQALATGQIHAFACDLGDPASIQAFAEGVGKQTKQVDILVNNAAQYLGDPDLLAATDEQIVQTIGSTGAGIILITRRFLPLLQQSQRPDILNMVSICGEWRAIEYASHPAYFAAKHAQAGFSDMLSRQLRPQGIRVIALYPPYIHNIDPLSAEWHAETSHSDHLTSKSVWNCVAFALSQARDCFIRSFYFESLP